MEEDSYIIPPEVATPPSTPFDPPPLPPARIRDHDLRGDQALRSPVGLACAGAARWLAALD